MVWMVEKKIVHHVLDMGFERVEIPVRVKFEFEVREGIFVSDSLSKETLYNQKAVLNRFPTVKLPLLDREIEKTVQHEIMDYLRQCGLLRNKSHDTT